MPKQRQKLMHLPLAAVALAVSGAAFADTLSCSVTTSPNDIQGRGEIRLNDKGEGKLTLDLKKPGRVVADFSVFTGKDGACRNAHLSIDVFGPKDRVSETSASFPCGDSLPDVPGNDTTRAILRADLEHGAGKLPLSVLCLVTVDPKPAYDEANSCIRAAEHVALAMANANSGGGRPPYRAGGLPRELPASGPRQEGDKSFGVSVLSSDGYDCNYAVNTRLDKTGGCRVGNVEFRMCAK